MTRRFFFFDGCGVLHDLHSFPTRRSSDLTTRSPSSSTSSRAGGELRTSVCSGCGPVPVTNRDRKSTRLNSSHSFNSYAVFCLKKKIENEKTDTQVCSKLAADRHLKAIRDL